MGSRNPELQKLLDNLTSYSPRNNSEGDYKSTNGAETSSQLNTLSQLGSGPSIIPGLGLLPPEPTLPKTTSSSSQQRPEPSETTGLANRVQKPPSASSRTDIPDPSSITTWPAALKHVTKHLAPNEAFQARIRSLIASQHKHEQSWSEGRQALTSMQSSRSTTSVQVSALLRSMGGAAVETKADAKLNEQELENYDEKIYASLVAMAGDFDRQLRGLGVPFYAIKHDLVISEEGREKGGQPAGRIDKGELRELQKRMLGLLEDLCGDD